MKENAESLFLPAHSLLQRVTRILIINICNTTVYMKVCLEYRYYDCSITMTAKKYC